MNIIFPNIRGEKLAGILNMPKKQKGAVMLIHGFCADKETNFFPKLAQKLFEQNYAVLRFDLSGYGKSEGKFENTTYQKHYQDTEAALTVLRLKAPYPVHVIGHSMGAAMGLRLARNHSIASLVMIGPPFVAKSHSMAKKAEAALKGSYVEFTDFFGNKRKLKNDFFLSTFDWDMSDDAKYCTTPTCTIIGLEDKAVSVSAALLATKAMKCEHKFVGIKKADHYFAKPQDEKKLIDEVSKWLNGHNVNI
ncbi:MAG: alpha/beta fold hydrolase [Candidatus Woesearchaeota archaeon]